MKELLKSLGGALLSALSALAGSALAKALLLRVILAALGAGAGFLASKFGIKVPGEQLSGWANEIAGALLMVVPMEIASLRAKWKLDQAAKAEAAGEAAAKTADAKPFDGAKNSSEL